MSVTAGDTTIFQREFNRRCVHSVTLAPYQSRNPYGDDTWGATTTYAAFVVFKQRQIVNRDGEQIGASGMAILAFNDDGTAPTVSDDDRFTLPDSTTPRILAVERDPSLPAVRPTTIFF